MKKNDTIIVLAWPKTPVISAMAWYEWLMKLLRINKDDFYIAGHAAAILVEHKTGDLKYFDFGRYHTPLFYGRVRDEEHDPDLSINIKAKFDNDNNIINTKEILTLISQKHACHGEGNLYASFYKGINFNLAYNWAKKLQSREKIIYGPFELQGSNCSRFVNQVFRAGKPSFYIKIRLLLPLSVSPLTTTNVIIGAKKTKNFFIVSTNGKITKHKYNFLNNLKYFALPG